MPLMSSRVVSFRFLHAVTNAVTGDQVTVGVLQWDGEQVRFASDSRKVMADHGRSTLGRALSAVRAQIPRLVPGQTALIGDIRDAFPVPEGEGSLLRWGEVRRGLATNPERHFHDLVELAELSDEAIAPHVGRREITSTLAALGENLIGKFGERVRVNTNVRNHFEFNSPLSWQNHNWHHTIPVNADVHSASDLRKTICEILGLVEAALPTAANAVLAFVPAQGNALAGDVEQGLNYVQSQFSSRVRLAPLQLTADGLVATIVEQMLIDDVSIPCQ
jgi:hypothetical protein